MGWISIIGSGGREHSLAHALAKSPGTSAVYVSPGNPGIGQEPKCHNLRADNEAELIRFALEEGINLIVIGPEGGLTDAELAHAQRRGMTAVHVGTRVLRAETAAIAALAIVNAVAGDAR